MPGEFDLDTLLRRIAKGTRNTRMTPSETPSAPSSTQEKHAGKVPANHPHPPASPSSTQKTPDTSTPLAGTCGYLRVGYPHALRPVQDEENSPSNTPLRVLRVDGAPQTRNPPQPPRGEEGGGMVPFALEDGEAVAEGELLRPERLALFLLGREHEAPLWLTTYPGGRTLVPPGHLRPHLLWRIRNLPPPTRLHLADTTGTLTMDIRAPVEAFLRAKVGRLEIILAYPREDLVAYLKAAKEAMASPDRLEVEWGGERWTLKAWKDAWERLILGREIA